MSYNVVYTISSRKYSSEKIKLKTRALYWNSKTNIYAT